MPAKGQKQLSFTNGKRVTVMAVGENDWAVPLSAHRAMLREFASKNIPLTPNKVHTPEGQWWLTSGREHYKTAVEDADDESDNDEPVQQKKKSKKEANALKKDRQWQGDLSMEAIEAIRTKALPGEYKEPPKPATETKSTGDRSTIESTKNPALVKLLEGAHDDEQNQLPFPLDKAATWQWDKKIIERGLKSYNKVYKPWLQANSSLQLLKLLQKNKGEIIGKELRRYFFDFDTVKRATSPSLIAALQNVTKRKDTANINVLLAAFVKQSGSTNKDRQQFLKQLGATKPDFIQHLKEYSLSSEFQTRNSLKLGVVQAAFGEKKNQSADERKIVESVVNLDPSRNAARVMITEIQNSFKQKNPISFMASDLFQFVRDTVDSDNIDDKIMLVQLCTGARWIEVVKISDFFLTSQTTWEEASKNPISAYHGHDPQRDIVQKGVAKVRRNKKAGVQPTSSENKIAAEDHPDDDEKEGGDEHSNLDVDNERILPPKPVLFVKPEMIQHVVYNLIRPWFNKALNGQLATTSNKKLAHEYNAKTNRRLATHHSLTANDEDSGRVKTHTLRKLYANYSYDVYAAKTITKPAWIQMVLGHLPNSFTTSLAYNTAHIFDAVPQNEEASEKFTTSEINSYLKQIKDADTTLLKVGEGVLTLPTVPRKGTSHIDRKRKFQELYKSITRNNMEPTYVLFQNLGFSNKYIQKQFKHLKKKKK